MLSCREFNFTQHIKNLRFLLNKCAQNHLFSKNIFIFVYRTIFLNVHIFGKDAHRKLTFCQVIYNILIHILTKFYYIWLTIKETAVKKVNFHSLLSATVAI